MDNMPGTHFQTFQQTFPWNLVPILANRHTSPSESEMRIVSSPGTMMGQSKGRQAFATPGGQAIYHLQGVVPLNQGNHPITLTMKSTMRWSRQMA
jgi:hypothetical protein